MTKEERFYKTQLQYDKEGAKANPVRLNGLGSADPEAIGKYLIQLYKSWKPGDEPNIGSLYGFDLYIRQHKEIMVEDGKSFEHRYNTFYAERPGTGIKYTHNQGHPNVDNPKLAARHFLNAIDKVSSLKEKYEKTLAELESEIPMIQEIVSRPFAKEKELVEMKSGFSNLEREIALKIQEKQMKEHGQLSIETEKEDDEAEITSVVELKPKPVAAIDMKQSYSVTQVVPRNRKAKGLRF